MAAAATERNGSSQRDYPEVIDYRFIPGDWMRQVKPHMHEGCFKIPEPGPAEIIYVTKGDYLCSGGTAFLERLPCGHVMKTPIPNPLIPIYERDHRRDMRLEARIYQKIGENPRVPKMINWDPQTDCLMIEYMENGNLGEYIRQNHTSVTSELRLRWAKQAAEGLRVLHDIGVVHCDVSPRNFLLDSNLDLRISDFAGASLDGSKPSAAAGERFRAPGTDWDIRPDFGDDIFSLGSLIYFIMTDKYPYEEIFGDEVEGLYERHVFPDISHVTCGTIIKRCWERQIQTAQEVQLCLEDHGRLGLENRQIPLSNADGSEPQP